MYQCELLPPVNTKILSEGKVRQMDDSMRCETFVRERITKLRNRRNVSEHRMSLELGKSGSYIRGITSGAALPSLRELFNIIDYFEMTPSEFFSGLDDSSSLRTMLMEKILELDNDDLEKVSTFITWIAK